MLPIANSVFVKQPSFHELFKIFNKNCFNKLDYFTMLFFYLETTHLILLFCLPLSLSPNILPIFNPLLKVQVNIESTEPKLPTNDFCISFRESVVAYWNPLEGGLVEDFYKSLQKNQIKSKLGCFCKKNLHLY